MNLSDTVSGQSMRNPLLLALKDRRVMGMAFDATLRDRAGTEHAIADSAAPILRPDGTMLGARRSSMTSARPAPWPSA